MTAQPITRIAMWSGPRNISTAMMRSFGNRVDTLAVDEPFYGVYLAETGLDHPHAAEVIAAMEGDWRRIVTDLTESPLTNGCTIHYQKHMTHHMLPLIDRGWLERVTNCFLIRDPAGVIASYREKRPDVSLRDIGLTEQVEIFEATADRLGYAPPVIDAADLLADPAGLLRRLCTSIEIPFDPAMLAWAAGRRPEDGIWAEWWYASVEASTGFSPPRPAKAPPPGHEALIDQARGLYQRLHRYRLTV